MPSEDHRLDYEDDDYQDANDQQMEGEDEEGEGDSDDEDDGDESSSDSDSSSSSSDESGSSSSDEESSPSKARKPVSVGQLAAPGAAQLAAPVNPSPAGRRALIKKAAKASGRFVRADAAGATEANSSKGKSKAPLSLEVQMQLLKSELKAEKAKRVLAQNDYCHLKEKFVTVEAELATARQAVDAEKVARAQDQSLHVQNLETLEGTPGGAAGAGRRKTDMHKVLNKPASYDGGNDECHVIDWLVAMFHYMLTLGVPVAMYVLTASTYLRGEALRFWTNRVKVLTVRQSASWDVFKEALLERFDSENTAVSARLKLDRLEQGGWSMAKFVQRFDHIASYIPDISDADLIHRFLEAVNIECKLPLQNDPSTGVRWIEYAKLRKYALNMYPSTAAMLGSGTRDQKQRKTKKVPRFSRPPRADLMQGASQTAGQMAGKPGPGVNRQFGGINKHVYSNSRGKSVTRDSRQKQAIMKAKVCGFCYGSGHEAPNCTSERWTAGMPPRPTAA